MLASLLAAPGCRRLVPPADPPATATPPAAAARPAVAVDPAPDPPGEAPPEPDLSDIPVDDDPIALWVVEGCAPLLSGQDGRPGAARSLELALAAVPPDARRGDPSWAAVDAWLDVIGRFFDGRASADFRAAWRAHLEARRDGDAETIAGLDALLGATEALPLYHVGVAAYVWRRAAPLPASAAARSGLHRHIERHLRIARAIAQGLAEAGPVVFMQWEKITRPPGAWTGIRVPRGLHAAALAHYPGTDLPSWVSEVAIDVTVVDAGATLLRGGTAEPVAPDTLLVLDRLDVLDAGPEVRLRLAGLGDMSLGPGQAMAAWDLAGRLSAPARARVRRTIATALDGDARAQARIAEILPAAHHALRDELARHPRSPGAAALRRLLAQYGG